MKNDLHVSLWPVGKPIPYARNARKISDRAIDKVASSIKEFGWRQPIVVDRQDVVIVGHARLLAAKKLGLDSVPVHVADNLSPAQVRAYRLMDNRSHEESNWDFDLLGPELQELRDLEFDLNLTGFDSDELDRCLAGITTTQGLTDEDEAPKLESTAVTCPGDLWTLGSQRLLCGDATSIAAIESVLGGGLADLVFTDPPYNVNYQGKTSKKLKIGNDALGDGFYEFLRQACSNMLAVSKGAIYVCMSSSELHTLHRAFADAGGHWSTFVIWAKHHFTLGRSDYQRQYEPILYGWRKGLDHFWCGARNQGDVWFINRPSASQQHPTMKPVELVERAIRNSSKHRDTILDPFCGSGTTLIACEKTGRQAQALELDPRYCDVSIRRWEAYTGKRAVLEGHGRTFEQIAKERGKDVA